jgi:hypothetical protein
MAILSFNERPIWNGTYLRHSIYFDYEMKPYGLIPYLLLVSKKLTNPLNVGLFISWITLYQKYKTMTSIKIKNNRNDLLCLLALLF